MLTSNPDLINSCRVCRSPNQDGDYECLYQINTTNQNGKPPLSESGYLYENLLDISLNSWYNYPQFLCNSCDLQMKLFKKLKDKAHKTMEYLQNLYNEHLITNENATETLPLETLDEYPPMDNEIETATNNFYQDEQINVVDSNTQEEQLEQELQCDEEILNNNLVNHIESSRTTSVSKINDEYPTTQYNVIIQQEASEEDIPNDQTKFTKLHLELDPANIIDKNDYVTEIYELVEDETNNDCRTSAAEYDIHMENKTESSSAFSDIEYAIEDESNDILQELDKVEELRDSGPAKKKPKSRIKTSEKEYKCGPCQLEFNTSLEYKTHRIEVHDGRYPCNICPKVLNSQPALHNHVKIHNDKPAYCCNICQKTFHQKAHYQYHMNRHNNVRNFKCSNCEKAFLSKADLKVHMRCHTGQRPYVCNICGKDYIMMEHLKAHSLTHTEEYFLCDICNNKFATHKTLRLHKKTIHEDDPRFKCNFCSKLFRRKHHLECHLRLHQSNVRFLDSHYEMVDDPAECNPDDLVDEDLMDNPGFIALNDDVISN